VGAGFGGLWAARALAGSETDVLLLDRNNYHTFLPLLYQVAAAELEPEQIVYPIRGILRGSPNVRFLMGEATSIDFAGRVVQAGGKSISYDYLILAAGSTTHHFGVPGAAEHAYSLKTIDDAIRLRNHILCCFERAIHETDVERRRSILTFAIVGGGPTGLEFAGALAELIRKPLLRDYPQLDFTEVRVVLVEARENVLPGLPQRLRAYAARRLRQMGVDVRVKSFVERVTAQALYLHKGETLRTETVVWTAGVRGVPAAQTWALPVNSNGRVVVLPTLQVPRFPEVYVVGDMVHFEQGGGPLPMIAPAAIQQGVAAATNIRRQIAGEQPLPFRYRDKGTMVTIGRNHAVAHVGGRTFTGFAAWILWLGVHLFKLIGFRNRLFVLANWAWDYFFYERGVRLIIPFAGCSDDGTEKYLGLENARRSGELVA